MDPESAEPSAAFGSPMGMGLEWPEGLAMLGHQDLNLLARPRQVQTTRCLIAAASVVPRRRGVKGQIRSEPGVWIKGPLAPQV